MADVLASVHSTPLLVSAAPFAPQSHREHGSHTDRTANPNPRQNENHDDDDDEKWIWVLDPLTRKLRVPVHLLNPTQATATSGTVPSLCIAYLEGRCRHPWCRQAHVEPSAIPWLRHEALNAPTCCHLHSDPHDISKLTNRFRYIRIVNNGPSGDSELIPTDRVASTVGLLRYLVHNVLPKKKSEDASAGDVSAGQAKEKADAETNSTGNSTNSAAGHTSPTEDDVLELPAKFICRLHLAHRCRYLEDCNNIHLCREYELQLQPPPHILGALNGVTTSTRTITVGDTCYTVTPLAVGDVSDEDFHAITEAQKIHHNNSNNNNGNHAGNANNLNASSMPWAISANPFDSAVPSTTGNSPMLYAHGGAMTPLSGPANANSSGAMFPSVPDYWQSPSLHASAVPGSSPCLQSTTSYMGGAAVPAPSTHLRVYDVRPKHAHSANNSITHSSHVATAPNTSSVNEVNTAPQKNEHARGAASGTGATSAATTTSSTPGSLPVAVNGHVMGVKSIAGTASGGSTSPATAAGGSARKHGVVGCSSTEGGVSISTSGANTPVTDGDYAAFLRRVVVSPSPKA